MATAKSRTIPAFVLNKSSRVMPGLRGTPAGMTTTSAPNQQKKNWNLVGFMGEFFGVEGLKSSKEEHNKSLSINPTFQSGFQIFFAIVAGNLGWCINM